MHGRLKVKTTEQQEKEKKVERAAKLKSYRQVCNQMFGHTKSIFYYFPKIFTFLSWCLFNLIPMNKIQYFYAATSSKKDIKVKYQ